MTKVVYLPLNGSIIQTGMYDAFKDLNVDLTIYDFYKKFLNRVNRKKIQDDFVKTVKQVQPDLCHMQLQFTDVISSSVISQAKKESPNTIFTNWTGDIRKNVPSTFIDASKAVDISLISSVGQLDLYKSALSNRDVRYWQIGYNPKLYFPLEKKNFKYDIAFIAARYKNSEFPDAELRSNIVKFISSKNDINFGLYGPGWGGSNYVHQYEVNDIYNDSFCCLSVSNFNDEYLYFSDRLLMCLASGRPTICWRFPGWECYFSDMKNIVIVSSLEEMYEKFKWLKSNVDIANKIGQEGAKLAFNEHSYFCRAAELLRMVGLQ